LNSKCRYGLAKRGSPNSVTFYPYSFVTSKYDVSTRKRRGYADVSVVAKASLLSAPLIMRSADYTRGRSTSPTELLPKQDSMVEQLIVGILRAVNN